MPADLNTAPPSGSGNRTRDIAVAVGLFVVFIILATMTRDYWYADLFFVLAIALPALWWFWGRTRIGRTIP